MDSRAEFSDRIKFNEVTKWFEKIRKAGSNKEKSKLFEQFLEKLKQLQKKFYDLEGSNANGSLFPFLRLFLTHSDKERDSYGLQMKTLGQLIVNVLAINKNSDDGKKLTLKGLNGDGLDYGEIVYKVMESRCPETSTLTVFELNNYLDLMTVHFKENERNKIDTEMIQMFRKLSAIDIKWLTRIILKSMKLGLGEKTMMTIYHKDATKFFDRMTRLSAVINAIESGKVFNENDSDVIQLFQPIRPMLCERGYFNQINNLLSKDEYYLETKMDGERCNIHINGREFRYFSRNCNDFTSNFGADPSGGLYTPTLYQLVKDKVQTAILDGEMMVFDLEDDCWIRKSEHKSARFLSVSDARYKPCFVIYDIIYFNGIHLMNKPYAERYRLLRTTFQEIRGTFMFPAQEKIRDAAHFAECFNKAHDANEEGVVIKQSTSMYRPGQREKGGWIKIKPDYNNNLIEDFDLLIIGASYDEYGTRIISFLLGVFKKDDDQSNEGVFHAVCTVKNGLTRAQKIGICEQLQPHWHKVDRANNRRIVSGVPGLEWSRQVPDVWIEPKNSIVLQVKGSALTTTDSFRTTHTIQFARVMDIRRDKPWYDVCTLNEFEKFISNTKIGPLMKRHVTSSDMNEPSSISLRKRTKKDPVPTFNVSNGILLDEIQPVDNVCDGRNFCVLSCEKKLNSIVELKAMIKRHGGRVVENPGPKTYVCIAGDKIDKVTNAIRSKKYNIVSTKWLVRTLGTDQPLTTLKPFGPNDMIFATDEMAQELTKHNHFDRFGDSYTEIIETEDELQQFLDEMKTDDLPVLTKRELHDIEVELAQGESVKNIFRLFTAFFYNPNEQIIDKDFEMAQYIFKTEAGNCLYTANDVKESTSSLTHIFVRDVNVDRTELWRTLETFGIKDLNDVVVLKCQWILHCYQQNQVISTKDYQIHGL